MNNLKLEELKPEIEDGNIEYKRIFKIDIDDLRLEALCSQMLWRVNEGNGEAIYFLGVNDDGTFYKWTEQEKENTIKVLKKIVSRAKLKILSIQKIYYENEFYYLKIIIREKNIIIPEKRILLLGPSGVGKTTFLANILLDKININDNESRLYLINHKHELKEKKTSSFNYRYIIYDNIKWVFIEVPGDDKYKKTRNKIFLSFGSSIDLVLFFDFKNNNWIHKDIYIECLKKINVPYININLYNDNSNNIFPNYSCKSLIDKKDFFDNLQKINKKHNYNSKIEFMILQVFKNNIMNFNDQNIILTGILKSGKIFENQELYLYTKNRIDNIKIKSIHLDGKPIHKISGPRTISICINNINLKSYNGFLSNNLLPKIKNISNNKFQTIYIDNQVFSNDTYRNYYLTNDNISIIDK